MSRLPRVNRGWISHLRLGGLVLASIWIGFRVSGMVGGSADLLDVGTYGVGGVLARLAVVVLAPLVVLAVHEGGHLLAGLGEGFTFSFYGVGPLWVSRVAGRVRVAVNRVPSTWGGATILISTTTRSIVRRMIFTVVAGPLASLLFALCSVFVFAQLRGANGPVADIISFFCVVAGTASAGVFVATLFPAGSGVGFHTDGARLFRLLKGGEAAGREAALISLYNLAASGVRPRDWPDALVANVTSLSDGSLEEATGAWWAHLHALDAGNADRAQVMYERARDLSPDVGDSFRRAIAADAAFYEATERGRLPEARRWLADAQGPLVSPLRKTIAAAVVAVRESRREDSLRLTEESERLLERSGLGVSEADVDHVRWLREHLPV